MGSNKNVLGERSLKLLLWWLEGSRAGATAGGIQKVGVF